jgi:transcriptional regulator with XRE-family HTH domain
MDANFGKYVKSKRLELLRHSSKYTLRQVALAIRVQPSFISKVEHGLVLPSEAKIIQLAGVLKEDPDVLLAIAGKVSKELRNVITRRPRLFGRLIRRLEDARIRRSCA